MIDLQELLTKSLVSHDSQRDRSKQVEIGPSSLGGCRRRVYHELIETPQINQTEKLAAILGTFIHSGIESVMEREDPFGENYLREIEVSYGGIKGHVDLYIKNEGAVVDWKTKKKSGLRYFPSHSEIWQVQVYGYLLDANGYEVKTVSLVAIPRDGEMSDIKVHSEDYNPEVAKAALQWLQEIKDTVANSGAAPDPEEKVVFCAKYCSYYDPSGEIGCPSTAK